jgi:hypothetical protein
MPSLSNQVFSLNSARYFHIHSGAPFLRIHLSDSGLVQLIPKHGVSVVCSSDRESDIRNAIEQIVDAKMTRESSESIRSDIMGSHQLQQLRDALTKR